VVAPSKGESVEADIWIATGSSALAWPAIPNSTIKTKIKLNLKRLFFIFIHSSSPRRRGSRKNY